jgi:hypothetical protein
MRFALNSLAVVAGTWLLEHSDPEWLEGSGHRIEEMHLPDKPTWRQAEASVIGRDGSTLLSAIFVPEAPPRLAPDSGGRDSASGLDPKLLVGGGPVALAKP